MPIRPSQRWFYPIDWTELSYAVRFERARGACERCGRRHGETVWHLSRTEVAGRRGLWWDANWMERPAAEWMECPLAKAERLGSGEGDQIDLFPSVPCSGHPPILHASRGAGRGAWRCEKGRALGPHHLPPPDDLARLHTQLAFWTGLERTDWPRRSLVVLACCHLDHDPTNCRDANLAALCQHCHLEHDRADNMRRRQAGMGARRSGTIGETQMLAL